MTPAEAARWMKEQLDSEEMLYQSEVAYTLGEHEDERLAYYDDDGNLCVGKQVLAEFRKITPDVVYVRSEKMWRRREDYDEPGRLQQEGMTRSALPVSVRDVGTDVRDKGKLPAHAKRYSTIVMLRLP